MFFMERLMGIIFSGIGAAIIVMVSTFIIKYYISRRRKDDDTFEEISAIFLELHNYRKSGTVKEDETEMISKIYQLSLKFRSKKYKDILPEIKDFGERYKDSIPPAGARSDVMEKHKNFWKEAETLKNKTEERMTNNNLSNGKKDISCLDKWAKIIGLVGGGWAILASIGGIIFFFIDRFDNPDLKIHGVVPIVNWRKSESDNKAIFHGISIIAHLQNTGNKPAYVSGADIFGKVYLKYDDLWSFHSPQIPEITKENLKELYQNKPYVTISWTGWIPDKKGSERIEPDEERFLKFVFAEPILSWGVYLFSGNPLDYIGYEKGDLSPKKSYHYTSLAFFCKADKERRIYDLRDEYKNGFVKISIHYGTKTEIVKPTKILEFRDITEAAWEEYTPRKIYFSEDL